jgi:GDP-D-mannose dehydratase
MMLFGDSKRAGDRLGWRRETSFEQIIQRMIDADL